MAKHNYGTNPPAGNVTVPTGYMVIPVEEYTRLVEEAAKHTIMEEHIPEEWCKSVLDIFMVGMDSVAYDMKQAAEIAEMKERKEEEKKRKAEEANHRCPDPGKLKSLMGAGWSADDIGSDFGVPTADVYIWMADLLLGNYDLAIGKMEVR